MRQLRSEPYLIHYFRLLVKVLLLNDSIRSIQDGMIFFEISQNAIQKVKYRHDILHTIETDPVAME